MNNGNSIYEHSISISTSSISLRASKIFPPLGTYIGVHLRTKYSVRSKSKTIPPHPLGKDSAFLERPSTYASKSAKFTPPIAPIWNSALKSENKNIRITKNNETNLLIIFFSLLIYIIYLALNMPNLRTYYRIMR